MTVVRRCSVKKVFLEISQNSQENTCARDSFLINLQACLFSCNFFCEISKNIFFRKTPPVSASGVLSLSDVSNAFGYISVHYLCLSANIEPIS